MVCVMHHARLCVHCIVAIMMDKRVRGFLQFRWLAFQCVVVGRIYTGPCARSADCSFLVF